jgi:5-methylcytosine-specific restriction endonuclease McrBC regulatory subunit McrC
VRALDLLLRVPTEGAVRAGLHRLAASFCGVARVPIAPSDIGRIPLTALTTRYADALGLAEIILRGQDLVPIGEGQSASSIVFSMPKVWEGFVEAWVRSRHAAETVEAQRDFALSDDAARRARADVAVVGKGRITAVYDAKYKSMEGAPAAGDLYQMVTYCAKLGLHAATLVYPSAAAARSISVAGRTITAMGLWPSAQDAHGWQALLDNASLAA